MRLRGFEEIGAASAGCLDALRGELPNDLRSLPLVVVNPCLTDRRTRASTADNGHASSFRGLVSLDPAIDLWGGVGRVVGESIVPILTV